MRFSAIVPIILSIVAFVLAILVLFAGKNTGFLTDTYIIKAFLPARFSGIDTSNLGGNGTTLDMSNTGNSFIDGIIDSATQSGINTVAAKFGLHDIYQVYVMNYCVGTEDTDGHKSLTNCTSQRGMFTFDPVKIFESELIPGTTLSDLGINRDNLNVAVEALKVAYRTMFVTYCLGIGFTGLCIILGLVGFLDSRVVACCNWISAVLALFFLGVASSIATAMATKLRDAINREMGDAGVKAYQSSKFLGMTWAAAAAMLVVIFFWCGACFSRRKERVYRKDAEATTLVTSQPAGHSRWTRWRR